MTATHMYRLPKITLSFPPGALDELSCRGRRCSTGGLRSSLKAGVEAAARPLPTAPKKREKQAEDSCKGSLPLGQYHVPPAGLGWKRACGRSLRSARPGTSRSPSPPHAAQLASRADRTLGRGRGFPPRARRRCVCSSTAAEGLPRARRAATKHAQSGRNRLFVSSGAARRDARIWGACGAFCGARAQGARPVTGVLGAAALRARRRAPARGRRLMRGHPALPLARPSGPFSCGTDFPRL